MAPPKRRSSSLDGDVIKKGCLIKSPPPYIINNQKAWKRRLFKLRKSPENVYTLMYYTYDGIKEEIKGEIFISDVIVIKHGSQLKEELELPLRVCGCTSVLNILFIKTKKRDFYLIDDNKEEIEDWRRCLTEAWKHMNQVTEEQSKMSSPLPAENHGSSTDMSQKLHSKSFDSSEDNQLYAQIQPNRLKDSEGTQRFHSHASDSGEPNSPPTISVPPKTIVYQHIVKEPSYDSSSGSDTGHIYDVPHCPPIKKRYSCSSNSSDLQETNDLESANNIYQSMESVEQIEQINLEKKEISVLTEHLKRYLQIEEMGERLCVAQWKGPREIGCLFRHGDQIDAMNDIWLNNKKMFYQILDNSILKEVRLSVISNKKAEVFHMKGCSCV